MFRLESGYIIFVIPAMIFAFWAQSRVRTVFSHYSRYSSRSGMTGSEIAQELLVRSGLSSVKVGYAEGVLGDHYDPRTRELRLSRQTHSSSSVAALGVAAHEVGHAVQHNLGYTPLAFRNSFLPIALFGSNAAFPLFFIGLIFNWPTLMDIGILFFFAAVLFQVITLPVEYNASNRAMAMLEDGGYVVGEEALAVRKVLDTAALTYVAAVAVSLAHLLRLLMIRGRRD